jgi:hypothetical protein
MLEKLRNSQRQLEQLYQNLAGPEENNADKDPKQDPFLLWSKDLPL